MISIVFALIGPFLLWPVELIIPLPFVFEELYKAGVVYFSDKKFITILLAGFLFTITESVFYSFDIFESGRVYLFFLRILITGILHTGTMIINWKTLAISKNLYYLGILLTMIVHYVFNLVILLL